MLYAFMKFPVKDEINLDLYKYRHDNRYILVNADKNGAF